MNLLGWKDKPIQRGDVKAVRVVEGLPIAAETNTYRRISHYHHEPKHILGTAPVDEDGSFYIKVPAETPLHFQTLDANGRALTTEFSRVFLIPGENKLCIGAMRTDPAPPGTPILWPPTVPPTVLDTPGEKREMSHFGRDIYPILYR